MRLFIGIAFLIALGCAGSASATQTTFPIKACSGCTAAQMQTSAKNSFPLGIGFIYDLHAHVIRKYEVYMDSTCGATPAPQTSTGGGVDCGSFKSADEMTPVDSTVQATFDALWTVATHNAPLVEGTERTYGIVNNSQGHPFDLQQVAWDYPQATYIDYFNKVTNILSTKTNANNLDLYLGDYLYGYEISSFHVEVSTPPEVLSGSLSWDRNSTLVLYICTSTHDDCSMWQVVVTNGVLSKTFMGILDDDNNIYPNANGQTPGNLTNWGFRNGGHNEGERFADEMRSHGVYIPTSGYCPPGTYPFLTTTRQNNQIIFQSWSCQQN